jgi:hypothetical protein
MGRLTLGGLAGRFLASLALVLATYNPTGLSFLSWVGGVNLHCLHADPGSLLGADSGESFRPAENSRAFA